jgi:hypothetical protein
MRLLCDRLGLKHKIIDDRSDFINVTVSKQDMVTYNIPSFDEIMRNNCLSLQLEHNPLFWKEISIILKNLDDTVLSIVATKLASSMKRLHPSPSWLLLFAEIFVQREIPLPHGFLHCAIKMCGARNDVYSLVEFLYLSFIELERSRSEQYQASCNRILSSGFKMLLPRQDFNNDMAGMNKEQVYPSMLSSQDWNYAAYVSYLSKPSFAHQRNFQEAFMEVITLSL